MASATMTSMKELVQYYNLEKNLKDHNFLLNLFKVKLSGSLEARQMLVIIHWTFIYKLDMVTKWHLFGKVMRLETKRQ